MTFTQISNNDNSTFLAVKMSLIQRLRHCSVSLMLFFYQLFTWEKSKYFGSLYPVICTTLWNIVFHFHFSFCFHFLFSFFASTFTFTFYSSILFICTTLSSCGPGDQFCFEAPLCQRLRRPDNPRPPEKSNASPSKSQLLNYDFFPSSTWV